MTAVEQRCSVAHGGIGGDDAPDHVAFQGRRRGAEQGRDAGESVEIIVDDHLAGDADHLAVGLDPVALLGFTHGAVFELTGLVDLLKLRRFTQLQALDVLEVGGGGAAGDGLEGSGCRLVGIPERLAGDGREDVGEVGGGVQCPCGDLVAGQATDADTFRFQERPGHLDQAVAPPFPGGIAQLVTMGIEPVQQRRLDCVPPRLGLIEPAHPNMRAGVDGAVTVRGLIDQHASGLVEGDTAANQIVGHRCVNAELAGGIVDGGNALPFLGDHPLGDLFGGGAGVTGLISPFSRSCVIALFGMNSVGLRRICRCPFHR
ncbi:MAG: hypothetical protein KIT00_12260 [Rhodospirillales bacterium]|nr:hypothetical protein [Rhodospirillales bacterium]